MALQPSWMTNITRRSASPYLPAEYPPRCNTFSDYTNSPPPVPAPRGPFDYGIWTLAMYKTCYEEYHATKARIEARMAAEQQAIVKAREIAELQQRQNGQYQLLLEQYQQLQQLYFNEKLAHQEETAQLIVLRGQIARITNILREAGLIV